MQQMWYNIQKYYTIKLVYKQKYSEMSCVNVSMESNVTQTTSQEQVCSRLREGNARVGACAVLHLDPLLIRQMTQMCESLKCAISMCVVVADAS